MPILPVYRFYAELDDYEPKIWRRFEINGKKTVAELGYVVMALFEMQAYHPFRITYDITEERLADLREKFPGRDVEKILGHEAFVEFTAPWRFEMPPDDAAFEDGSRQDATQYRLTRVFRRLPAQFLFEYDYADGWKINLTLEDIQEQRISSCKLPRALEGAGFGIVEGCGGKYSLEALARSYKRKKGRQYDRFRNWLGVDELDMEAFNIDEMNVRVRQLPKIYKKVYEQDYEPPQHWADRIERKTKKKRKKER